MNYLQNLVEQVKKRRKIDKEIWENMPRGVCQVCNGEGDDRRSLIINVGYELKEVSNKFLDLTLIFDSPMYGLRMCKGCRGALMAKLSEWLKEKGRLRFENLDEEGLWSSKTWPVEPKERGKE